MKVIFKVVGFVRIRPIFNDNYTFFSGSNSENYLIKFNKILDYHNINGCQHLMTKIREILLGWIICTRRIKYDI